jgi:hypothetical protein
MNSSSKSSSSQSCMERYIDGKSEECWVMIGEMLTHVLLVLVLGEISTSLERHGIREMTHTQMIKNTSVNKTPSFSSLATAQAV